MAARIYAVYHRTTGVVRLVRAAHPARARDHVAASTYDVRVASQDDIVAAMSDGTKVETAGAEPDPEPETDPQQQTLPVE